MTKKTNYNISTGSHNYCQENYSIKLGKQKTTHHLTVAKYYNKAGKTGMEKENNLNNSMKRIQIHKSLEFTMSYSSPQT